eukprot:TRINITY_DN68128_c0_g1_i1.p1 TRINITY_DN68128_c0_g1~~TRINITY_DN68128_c0_g1_i1.p1  ORF type:complete len:476 (+),score=57.23 TRINITY_DN68128_c0_g1_i1:213-1430(+)
MTDSTRELPLGHMSFPPMPTELKNDFHPQRFVNTTTYWKGYLQAFRAHPTNLNLTNSWILVPLLDRLFFRICAAMMNWQTSVRSLLQSEMSVGITTPATLWLILAGIVSALNIDMLQATVFFPPRVRTSVRRWVVDLVSYAKKLNDWVCQKASTMPSAWGTPKRLYSIFAHMADITTSMAMIGSNFVSFLLIIHCVGSPRLRAWEFHAELGFHRAEVMTYLAHRSGKDMPRVVELGVYTGSSSARVIVKSSGVAFLGVDPYFVDGPHGDKADKLWSAAESAYAAAVKAAGGVSSATLVRLTSVEAAFSGDLWRRGWHEVDVLFIDTEKSYASATRDIVVWAPRVQPGGCVSGHDFSAEWMGTPSAVIDLLPRGATLHLGPDSTWWWCRQEPSDQDADTPELAPAT